MAQYIALSAVQLVDDNGVRQAIEPRQEGKSSGLFEHTFDKATEARLLAVGAIRLTEGTEQYEDPTPVVALEDSRVIEGEVNVAAEDDKKPAKAPKASKADVAVEPVAAEDTNLLS